MKNFKSELQNKKPQKDDCALLTKQKIMSRPKLNPFEPYQDKLVPCFVRYKFCRILVLCIWLEFCSIFVRESIKYIYRQ